MESDVRPFKRSRMTEGMESTTSAELSFPYELFYSFQNTVSHGHFEILLNVVANAH